MEEFMAYDDLDKLTKLDWNQFGERMDKLFAKVKKYFDENEIKLSAIVPILREGGFVALPFCYRFNTWKIIPIQFKYFLKPGVDPYKQIPTQISELPELHYDLPDEPVFLLTDVFPGGGRTCKAAGEALKKKYPKSKLFYASMFQDVAFVKPEIYEESFYQCQTDDTDQFTMEEKVERGIETEYYLMPWHNADEEMAPILEKEYNYDF